MTRRRKSRFLNPFGLAFLDVMSCGLGAAVLLFLIIDHNLSELAQASDSGEVDVILLEQQIAEEEQKSTDHQRITVQLDRELRTLMKERIVAIQQQALLLAEQTPVTDNKQLVKTVREQERRVKKAKGQQLLQRRAEAKRQYVAGFQVEGHHILILLDRSASMMDREIATVIRNRFLPVSHQRDSIKWRWTRTIFEWLLAHLPAKSRYQVLGFNTTVTEALPRQRGWLLASGKEQLREVIASVRGWVPSGGTRFDLVVEEIHKMRPRPDAVYLITDGLPTQGEDWLRLKRVKVSASQRMDYFRKAFGGYRGPPLHVVLLPLEGDPGAAGAFWRVAMKSGGQFLVPSEDWP